MYSHNISIFVGLTSNPTVGKWFNDIVSEDCVTEAYSQIKALHGNGMDVEIEIHDSEAPLPLAFMSLQNACEAIEWLNSSDGEQWPAALITAAYEADIQGYRDMLENGVYGPYSSRSDWAYDYLEQTGQLDKKKLGDLIHHIDFDSWAREQLMGSFTELKVNGEYYYVHD